MSLKRKIMLGFVLFGVSGCATSQKVEPTKVQSETPLSAGLQAQELTSGECGIFFWTKTAPRTFVFFHKQGDANAKYYLQDIEIAVQTDHNTNNMSDNAGLLIDYSSPNFETFSIKGQFTDLIEGGRRISNAIIKTKKPEAWEEIQPVSGVYVCK